MTGDAIPKKKFYVQMTDFGMSGWGRAEYATSKSQAILFARAWMRSH